MVADISAAATGAVEVCKEGTQRGENECRTSSFLSDVRYYMYDITCTITTL